MNAQLQFQILIGFYSSGELSPTTCKIYLRYSDGKLLPLNPTKLHYENVSSSKVIYPQVLQKLKRIFYLFALGQIRPSMKQ